jgi:5'-3' exonuclease
MLALIDADSIIYTVAFVNKSPGLCKKAYEDKIKEIMDNTEATKGLVFLKGPDNFRYLVDPDYKGHRKDGLDEDVKERIKMLYEYANDSAILSHNGEADDYVHIAAQEARSVGDDYVVCCIDKDLQQIAGLNYNYRSCVIRLITDEEAYRFTMKQFLTGDATDNIRGIHKLGPKTADKLLDHIPVEQLWDNVIKIWSEKLPKDEWKEPFIKCANNIYIRRSIEALRPMTYEELEEDFKWIQDTGNGQEMTSMSESTVDSSTSSDVTIQKNEDFTSEENSST